MIRDTAAVYSYSKIKDTASSATPNLNKEQLSQYYVFDHFLLHLLHNIYIYIYIYTDAALFTLTEVNGRDALTFFGRVTPAGGQVPNCLGAELSVPLLSHGLPKT